VIATQSNPAEEKRPGGGFHDQNTLVRFESKLAPFTKVPIERAQMYLTWSHDDVRREANGVARVLKRFANAVVSAVENPQRARQFLRTLDLKLITRDHDWRAIFSTMRSNEASGGAYQRAALIKYLQYLSFRKRLLDFILAKKQGLEEIDEFDEVNLNPGDSDTSGKRPLFEVPPKVAGDIAAEQFVRLATGESVAVRLEEGEKVELKLGSHPFRLVHASPPCLMDQNGLMYFLRPGRNMIGRHPESDVALDPDFGNVSRAHLIIERESDAMLRLMDLSSRGTFLRREALQRGRRLDA
jgi:hypothetical protein